MWQLVTIFCNTDQDYHQLVNGSAQGEKIRISNFFIIFRDFGILQMVVAVVVVVDVVVWLLLD